MEKEIRINVVAPVECTDEQFQEWVEYSLGYIGCIRTTNPLFGYDLEAKDENGIYRICFNDELFELE